MCHLQWQQLLFHWLLRGGSFKMIRKKDHAFAARLYPGPLGATVSLCWSCATVSGSLRAPTDGASVLWQWDSRRGDHDKFRFLDLLRGLQCLQYRLFLRLLQRSCRVHKLNVLLVRLLCPGRLYRESCLGHSQELQCRLQCRNNKQA
jgi:hypothetical protein